MKGKSKIPFVKPVRVGNFKLWRARYQMSVYPDLEEDERKRIIAEKGKVRKEKVDVECINISNLDGTWKVQIPATFEMFAVLDAAYDDFIGDETQQKRAESVFALIIGNMMYASAIGNGYYHRALEMIATCYANPTMLVKKGGHLKELKKDASKLIENFLVWRKEYDSMAAEPTEEEMKRDEIAEQASEIIKEKDNAVAEDTRGTSEEKV